MESYREITGRTFNRKQFRRTFIRYLLIPAASLLILGIFTCIIAYYSVFRVIKQNNNGTIHRISDYMDQVLYECEELNYSYSNSIYLNILLKRILQSDEKDYEISSSMSILQSVMFSQSIQPHIHSIYIYYNNPYGRFLTSSEQSYSYLDSYYDTDWYTLCQQKTLEYRPWSAVRELKRYSFEKVPVRVLTIFIPIKSSSSAQTSDYAIVNLNASYMETIIENTLPSADEGQMFAIMNENGEIVLHSPGLTLADREISRQLLAVNGLIRLKIAGRQHVVTSVRSAQNGWTYYIYTPQNVFFHVPALMLSLILLFVFLMIVIEIPLLARLSKKSQSTLENIIDILDAAKHNQILSKENMRKDSYEYIIQSILNKFIENNLFQTQLSERRYHMQVLELLALQSQINPHFLFNTLHFITWNAIALTGGPNPASEMIESLSTLLNYTLRDPLMEVTLAEEIQCTVCYIDILKARFPDNFNIRWQFNEPLPEIKVPKLLFQPLIENSITHGAGSFRKAISIDIRIEEFSGYTGITLTDDGQGILPSRLEEIRRQMSQADSADTKHVGLFNLYKRLRLFYSGGCSLTINSKPSEGTTIHIKLPAVTSFPGCKDPDEDQCRLK